MVVERINTFILYSVFFFSKNCAVYEVMWKKMQYLLCFHGNSGCAKTPHYIIHTLPVFFCVYCLFGVFARIIWIAEFSVYAFGV
jgi:hypothetical protein